MECDSKECNRVCRDGGGQGNATLSGIRPVKVTYPETRNDHPRVEQRYIRIQGVSWSLVLDLILSKLDSGSKVARKGLIKDGYQRLIASKCLSSR